MSHRGELPLHVVGLDAADVERAGETIAVGAAVVLDSTTFEVVDQATSVVARRVEYQPGRLAQREAPMLLAAIKALAQPPKLMVCDGHGLAHPQRNGLACHVGAALNVPTIGCAKNLFVGGLGVLADDKGSTAPITDGGDEGDVVGAAVRTRAGVKPVYVSPGYGIDIDTSVRHILALAPRFRLPETTRQADRLAREAALNL